MNTFIDNVAVFAVEHCLLDRLPDLFNTDVVGEMSDSMLDRLAAESEAIKADRRQQSTKKETLLRGLDTCLKYDETVLPGVYNRTQFLG